MSDDYIIFKDCLPDFHQNKQFRLLSGFAFIDEGKDKHDYSDDELDEEVEGESLYHISMLMGEEPDENKIESAIQIYENLKMHFAVRTLFESPPPLDALMNLTCSNNSDLSFYSWKIICRLTKLSDFCVSYFVKHNIMRELCRLLIDSDDATKLKFVLKTMHHIAGSETKENFMSIFKPINVKDGCNKCSPLVCIMSTYEKHIDDLLNPSITPPGAVSSFADEDDDVYKIRSMMLIFLNACIGCLAKSKLSSQVSEISELIAKSLSLPYVNLELLALEGINKCMKHFPEFAYTYYKDKGLEPLLKLLLKEGPPHVTLLCMEVFISVFEFKHDDAARMFEVNFFDEISIFLNPEDLKIDAKDGEILKKKAVELVAIFLEILNYEIKDGRDKERSARYLDVFNRFMEKDIFWKLDDVLKASAFDAKIEAAMAISFFINTAPDENVAILISEHSTMINGLCTVLSGVAFKGIDKVILALDSLLHLFVKVGHFEDFIEILNEMDTRDEIERIIDDDSIPKSVRFNAKTLSGDILEQLGEGDSD